MNVATLPTIADAEGAHVIHPYEAPTWWPGRAPWRWS